MAALIAVIQQFAVSLLTSHSISSAMSLLVVQFRSGIQCILQRWKAITDIARMPGTVSLITQLKYCSASNCIVKVYREIILWWRTFPLIRAFSK